MLKVRALVLKLVWIGGGLASSVAFADYNQNEGYQSQYPAYQAAQAPASAKPVITSVEKKEIDDAALQALIKQYFPMSRDQVHAFKDASADQKKTNAMPPGPAPTPPGEAGWPARGCGRAQGARTAPPGPCGRPIRGPRRCWGTREACRSPGSGRAGDTT